MHGRARRPLRTEAPVTITIAIEDTDRLGAVLLALVRNGLTFRCTADPDRGCWYIQLTGGY